MTLSGAQKKLLVGLLLCIVASLAYWPVTQCGFVDYDDNDYITQNPDVQDGLTLKSITWAFSTSHAANWHPLTWLSHMLDVQAYGLRPAGHHLTSVAFHAMNTALLFFLLAQMTGALWRSAFAAALFALHPTHVESVAWISERKDVLSTFFALLTLSAYAAYTKRKSTSAPQTARFYILSLALFALGLMSKPMLVTLPFLLLLLDYWPLARFDLQNTASRSAPILPLLSEKIPFFILSAISSVITFLVQHSAGATVSTVELSFTGRVTNVLVAYARYLGKLFWPDNLAVFYPRPDQWPLWQVAGSALLLALVTALVLRFSLRQRYLPVGWFWFLGTLVPVIGLVQVGEQAIADRYTYIPSIGIFIAASWGAGELLRRHEILKIPLAVCATCVLLALGILTLRQTEHWKTTETLFRHTAEVTKDNFMAEESLGSALSEASQFEEAEHHFSEALRIRPGFHEAIVAYAVLLHRQGKAPEALARFGDSLRQHSEDVNAHFALAQIYTSMGNTTDAINEYNAGLRLKPNSPDALNNLAWIRATSANPTFRNGAEAVQLSKKACELTRYRKPMIMGTLAAAYAEAGRFQDAVAAGQKARDLAAAEGKKDLADKNQELLELYQKGTAYHEPPPSTSPPSSTP